MRIGPPHARKYPYANESFFQDKVAAINKSTSLNHDEFNVKRTNKQIEKIKENAAPGDEHITKEIFMFLNKLITFGSEKYFQSAGENKLGQLVIDNIEDIYGTLDIAEEARGRVETKRLNSDEDTNPATNLDPNKPAIQTPSKDLSFEESQHGKGLILNFISDYLLERNYLGLTPSKTFKSSFGTEFDSASVSITGAHTEAINSDSVQEAKDGSTVLGVLADGISNMINPHDTHVYRSIKKDLYQGIKSEEEAKLDIDILYEKDTYSYGSHNLAKSLTKRIAEFDSVEKLLASQAEAGNQILSDQANRTLDFLKKQPDYFWNFFIKYIESNRELSKNANQNFFENLAESIENDTQLKNFIENTSLDAGYQLPGFCDALRDKNLQLYLAALAPLIFAKTNIERDFSSAYIGHPNDVSGGAQLSYAVDLGEKIALVRIGDSAIKALNSDAVICQKTNFSDDPVYSEHEIMGSIHIDYSHKDAKSELSVLGYPFIELINKKDIDTIFMSSDGVFDQEKYKDSLSELLKKLSNFVSQQKDARNIVYELLKNTPRNDDRSMLVLKKLVDKE